MFFRVWEDWIQRDLPAVIPHRRKIKWSKPLILPSFHWELNLCARMELTYFSSVLSSSEVIDVEVGRTLTSLYWMIKYLNIVLDVKLIIL